MKRLVNPASLGKPSGFSHGVLADAGRLLFVAGQTGSDASGRILSPGNLVAQFERTLRNVCAVVAEAGGKPDDVVELTIFVASRDDYAAKLAPLGKAYRAVFGGHYPAMALFEVSGFFQKDALVEVQARAVIE